MWQWNFTLKFQSKLKLCSRDHVFYKWTDRLTEGQTGDRRREGQRDGQTEGRTQTDGWTDGRTDGRTDRQTDRWKQWIQYTPSNFIGLGYDKITVHRIVYCIQWDYAARDNYLICNKWHHQSTILLPSPPDKLFILDALWSLWLVATLYIACRGCLH